MPKVFFVMTTKAIATLQKFRSASLEKNKTKKNPLTNLRRRHVEKKKKKKEGVKCCSGTKLCFHIKLDHFRYTGRMVGPPRLKTSRISKQRNSVALARPHAHRKRHSNRNLARLQSLSPGMCVNIRCILLLLLLYKVH